MNDELTLEATIDVEAAPAEVWAVVSDLRRMGEWSPECRRMVAWGGVREGAWVLGVNRRGPMVWPTNSRITRYEPPTAIAWRVLENGTEWSYQLTPTDSGTRLTERRVAPAGVTPLGRAFARVFLGGPRGHDVELLEGMQTSLRRIRTEVERGRARGSRPR